LPAVYGERKKNEPYTPIFKEDATMNASSTLRLILTILAAVLLAISASGLFQTHLTLAADGTLDPTFGTDGKVTTHFLGLNDTGHSVAIQSDGKIVVVGQAWEGTSASYFAVARYNSNGSLDTTFDGDGKVTTGFGTDCGGSAVAIQSDHNIVVVGTVVSNTNDFAVVRYNNDGSLDTTFDGDGKVTTDFGGEDEGRSVAIQSDDKIVVAGIANGGKFALARYNSNGGLDSTFNGDGKVMTDFGNGSAAFGITIQSDGKIVVVGSAYNGSNDNFAIARYNSNGNLDTTFDGDGKVVTDFGSGSAGHDVAIQTNGKIVVAGEVGSSVSYFAVARYNGDGSLDDTFHSDGKVTTDFFGSLSKGYGIALRPEGRIVVAGFARENPGITDFAVARYNNDGSLDSAFHADGRVTTNFLGGHDYGYDVAIQTDGNIVVIGTASSGDFAVARYLAVNYTHFIYLPLIRR
jgi:uncharacterized delta-60 repeat protein